MYVKVYGTDGSIISAEEHASPVYVCYQAYNDIVMRCTTSQAQGIVSADQSQIYQLQGRLKIPGKYRIAEEISKADYEQLVTELDIDGDTPAPDDPDEDGQGADIMTAAEMREAITELKASKEFLEECILEMSEILYG